MVNMLLYFALAIPALSSICAAPCLDTCTSGYTCFSLCCDYDPVQVFGPLISDLNDPPLEVAENPTQECKADCVENCYREKNNFPKCLHVCECSPEMAFDYPYSLEVSLPAVVTEEERVGAFEALPLEEYLEKEVIVWNKMKAMSEVGTLRVREVKPVERRTGYWWVGLLVVGILGAGWLRRKWMKRQREVEDGYYIRL